VTSPWWQERHSAVGGCWTVGAKVNYRFVDAWVVYFMVQEWAFWVGVSKSLVSCHLSSIRCIKLRKAAVNPMDLLLSRKNWDIFVSWITTVSDIRIACLRLRSVKLAFVLRSGWLRYCHCIRYAVIIWHWWRLTDRFAAAAWYSTGIESCHSRALSLTLIFIPCHQLPPRSVPTQDM
jgi:hypothetical protein